MKGNDTTSVREKEDASHDKEFIDRLDVLRPFALLTNDDLRQPRWLAYSDKLDRMRDPSIFETEKVLISANRNPGSSWRLVAAIDRRKLYFSDNFHGIIPTNPSIHSEEIAAVLNSPLANAWFDANCRKRKIVQSTLETLPFPVFEANAAKAVRSLVKQLERAIVSAWKRQEEGLFHEGIIVDIDASQILREIDALVYDAFGIVPTERKRIEQVMGAEKRPG